MLQKAAEHPMLQASLLEQCRRNPAFWFDSFCWTFDPRRSQPHQPFVLYPYQRHALTMLTNSIAQGADLLIDKSRDMGVSWLVLLAFQHQWLFQPGSNFHLGSRKQESVDRKGDISTLFEKLRYNLEWMPHWMLPSGFQSSTHDNLMRLINPANGNIISGESSNANFGRGGRYRAVLFDEFPFWPDQDAAFASAGQSTPCRIVVGTPYGKANRFAELRFSSQINVLSLHWKLHPHKDQHWYQQQLHRMSEDEIARELDINYSLSVKGRVFKQFSEENKADLQPNPELPVIRSWDFGYHCPACLFLQVTPDHQIRVLAEVIGQETLLIDFAQQVIALSGQQFPDCRFEDVCDPAGAQKSDKNLHTCIEILNSLNIYPWHERSAIRDGIELIRMKLTERQADTPGLLVDRGCHKLIDAFEFGYRYTDSNSESPYQEHPYEDVMDCLRYALIAKGRVSRVPSPGKRFRAYQPQNRYTGY